ncbi:hypothetical protein [Vibrio sp. TRT 2004]|uniref:hypothetical protein n=1 Tax=Vibrio sp. TRT 2004 TaxID=3418506 RepID=UPI003CF985F5
MYVFSLSGTSFKIRLQIFLMIIEKAVSFLFKGKTYWIGEIDQKNEDHAKDSIPLPVDVKLFELSQVDKVQVRRFL